jgi:hypothetical protein
MRLILIALLALSATAAPAFAQGTDPRVEDVSESADGFSCRAQALPELRIAHDWRDGERRAALDLAGRESRADVLRMRTAFRPDDAEPFGAAASVLGFQLELQRAPLRAAPRVAHLRVDGASDPTALEVEGDTQSIAVAVTERLRPDLARRLMRASIVEVDLVDATSAPLGRFSWDVRNLRRAPELLQIVNWSCR